MYVQYQGYLPTVPVLRELLRDIITPKEKAGKIPGGSHQQVKPHQTAGKIPGGSHQQVKPHQTSTTNGRLGQIPSRLLATTAVAVAVAVAATI